MCAQDPMPNGKPPFLQASAALRKVLGVPVTAFGRLPPDDFLHVDAREFFHQVRSREQGPLIWLPIQAGTPSHLSPALPRYCTVPFTSPFCLISGSMMSFTGKNAIQLVHEATMSASRGCRRPDFAWPSVDVQEELAALGGDVVD